MKRLDDGESGMKKLVLGVAMALVAGSAFAAGDGHPTIGIAEFTNQTGAGWWRGGVGWELSDMLSNELSSSGDFHVVERQKLQNVMEEQNLAASGRVAKGTGAKIGKLTGAQYLITGTVSAYEENTSSTGGGFAIKGIGLGGKSSEAYLAIDLRVIDTTTGDVAFSRTVEGKSKSTGVAVGVSRGGFSGNLAHEENTPAGKAIRAALVEATDYLDCAMVKKGSCMDEFNAKEQKRRAGDKKALKLD
jgi:curli biogenesis system outer membrane secretion channel CsgG